MSATRIARGDFQTPSDLARAVAAVLSRRGLRPRVVLEPTCGVGAFLQAAAETFTSAELLGFEIDAAYVRTARRAVPRAQIRRADFFATDWERVVAPLEEPVLVLGNPPWVTNATLGALGATNLPQKENLFGLRGLEARTGASNFDIALSMLLRLLNALRGRRFTLAMLIKATVARKLVEVAAASGLALRGELRRIDAKKAFGAMVDAVLLVAEPRRGRDTGWPVFADLGATVPEAKIGVREGTVIADLDAWETTRHLVSSGPGAWRSGIKHDCADVFEVTPSGRGYIAAGGERVRLDEGSVFPLLKSSDVANGRLEPRRALIVPQRSLQEDEQEATRRAPATMRYLRKHAARLAARKSSIYEGRPAFSIFGVGDYSFAPYKVAISGLYKKLVFRLVPPTGGKPVMLDDTCYFLPFEDESKARAALAALESEEARGFFTSRIFWDAKRPITKKLLDSFAVEQDGGTNSPRRDITSRASTSRRR